MDYTDSLEQINSVLYMLKLFFISLGTYYVVLKNINDKNKIVRKIICICVVSIICGIVKEKTNSMNSIVCLILLLSIIFSKSIKNSIGYYIVMTTICLAVNYILFLVAVAISYIPNRFINIHNNYMSFIGIIIIYICIILLFFKIKKFKKGFSFLKEKLTNEYFNILILNISSIILFGIIILSNYNKEITESIGIGLFIFSIIMFATIQKSLQLYYKQKLLIQDLNETKEELERKKQEVEELEKENLNFSKASHSIAHKQKALEYKLNQLMLNTEIADEIDIQDRIKSITKDLQNQPIIELPKTKIPQIDDMLTYMQSECTNNKIDFQLQLNGNIHYMINHHISIEKLEILLADLIKNAIIAINYSKSTNKSILVRLGMLDGIYSLYVYDSGIEFEEETLKTLGTKPSTTHADNGGTGMGFMNIFDTLKQYKASITIQEYGKPSKDNFTKVIKIKFDNKNEFTIDSYRQEKTTTK